MTTLGGKRTYRLVRKGEKCSDCGLLAVEMDHRDYNRMKDVDPVCHWCNIQRGPGIPLKPRDWTIKRYRLEWVKKNWRKP